MERALREILARISEDPEYYPAPLDIIADEIVRKIKQRIVKIALQHKREPRFSKILDDLLSPIYNRRVPNAYYYLTHELGLEKEQAIDLITKALEVLTELSSLRTVPPVEATIIDHLIEILEGKSRYGSFHPLPVIDYAYELGLIYWDGERWNITELGRLILKLPPHEFVKALLTLETTLSKNSLNCMTYDFIKMLKDIFSHSDSPRLHFIVENARERGIHSTFLIHTWLSRLESLGVIRLNYRDKTVKANPYTMYLLETIVDRDSNVYFTLIQSILSYKDPPLITTNLSEHLNRIKDDHLVAECWDEVKQAINAVGRGDYHATLRTLLPVIERILREICVREGISGTDKGLKALVEIAKGYKLISERTENLIKALGRDVELHGLETLDLDRAKFYAELALVTFLELVRDYKRHKMLRQVLRIISKDLNITFEELINAYPYNRRIIHVQFTSDEKARVTVKGRYVYEAFLDPNGEIKVTHVAQADDSQLFSP